MIVPVNVPKVIAVSKSVSNSCKAVLILLLSVIIVPVNVPKSLSFSATPVSATNSLLMSLVRPAPIIKILPLEAWTLVTRPTFCTFSVEAVGRVVVNAPAVESR